MTDPGRAASATASRPGPQPYSSVDIGEKCGEIRCSMMWKIQSTSSAPLAKNSSSRSGVRFARRNFAAVSTAKYGSRSANALKA